MCIVLIFQVQPLNIVFFLSNGSCSSSSVVDSDHTRKLNLSSRPASVDDLIKHFEGQYEDPDFDGQLTYLMDIEELPQKVTLHLLVEGGDTSSTADTEILSEVSSPERLNRCQTFFLLHILNKKYKRNMQQFQIFTFHIRNSMN
ncbi:unnamed protein product [Oncorhynchus mykiss]|uniref:Uncharacterized protein n=1 Tax=Oncorhynchus mykiss TaxID=8022 RepID=A0A060X892_ONCMY|nr:unnamed protein product [Oncorhynchus mykiss]